ncbi:MAG: AAA family ATPase [Anaerolineales bacterium]|nr:AAA family ATPase [Anaerolineales bacterium]
MTKSIVAIVGMCGSGKSVAGGRLEQLGYVKVYFGGLTIEEVKRRGLEVNEKNERAVREELRETHGMGAFAVLSLPKIEALRAEGKRVLIDGLYSFSEYKILKQKYGDGLLVVAVVAPRALRYERLAHRPVRPLTEAEAVSRDYAEIDNIEKGGPIALADYTILNDGPVEDLVRQLDRILETGKSLQA